MLALMANSYCVPLGFRFHPTDQELILSFLYKIAVEREPLMPPYNNIVRVEDLFGTKEPWNIWEEYYGGDQFYDQDLYFFCELKKLTPNSSRVDRKIGHGGTWSEGEPSKLVYNEDNENPSPIGRKRKFRYENPKSEHHAGWYMDEYSLFVGAGGRDQKASKNHYTSTSTSTTYDLDNCVICRLRKNDRSGGNKKKYYSLQEQSKEIKDPTNKKGKLMINIDDEEVSLGYSSPSSNKQIDIAYGFDPILLDDRTTFAIEELLETLDSESPSSNQQRHVAETSNQRFF